MDRLRNISWSSKLKLLRLWIVGNSGISRDDVHIHTIKSWSMHQFKWYTALTLRFQSGRLSMRPTFEGNRIVDNAKWITWMKRCLRVNLSKNGEVSAVNLWQCRPAGCPYCNKVRFDFKDLIVGGSARYESILESEHFGREFIVRHRMRLDIVFKRRFKMLFSVE